MALEILHKKSGVSQKLSVASDIKPGELALNYNADGPFLTVLDSAGDIRKLNHVWVSATAPSNPTVGDPWLDISGANPRLWIYKDGVSNWVPVVNIVAATATVPGIVMLADATAIANGTPQRVVDAAQLKSALNNIAYLTALTADQPLKVGGAPLTPSLSIDPGAAHSLLATNSAGDGVEFTQLLDGGSY